MKGESMKQNTLKNSASESRRDFLKNKLMASAALLLGFSRNTLGGNFAEGYLTDPEQKLADDNGNVNWAAVKAQFTLNSVRHHFNTASIGPSPKVVQDEIIQLLRLAETFGNELHEKVEPVRQRIAKFLNAPPTQIAITRNTTEGMNIVARSLNLKKGDEVILTSEEHIGGSAPWLALKNEIGVVVKVINTSANANEEDIYDQIEKSITVNTKVISVSHITCTTGTVLPVKKIIDLCAMRGITSCIDGAQAVGQIPVDLSQLQPDFYVTSGHKWMFGPKGTGILYLNQQFLENTDPHYVGSYSDSRFDLMNGILEYNRTASRYEYGTRNSPIIAGLGSAIDFINKIGIENISNRGRELALRFRNGISRHPRIKIHTPMDSKYSASIVTFTIEGKQSDEVCRKAIVGGRTVLRSIYENDMNAIRASFAIHNDYAEVDKLIQDMLNVADSED